MYEKKKSYKHPRIIVIKKGTGNKITVVIISAMCRTQIMFG